MLHDSLRCNFDPSQHHPNCLHISNPSKIQFSLWTPAAWSGCPDRHLVVSSSLTWWSSNITANWRIPINCKVTSSYPAVHTREPNIMSSGPSAVTAINKNEVLLLSFFSWFQYFLGSFALVAQLLQTRWVLSHHRPKLRWFNIHSTSSNGPSNVLRSKSPCQASRFDHNLSAIIFPSRYTSLGRFSNIEDFRLQQPIKSLTICHWLAHDVAIAIGCPICCCCWWCCCCFLWLLLMLLLRSPSRIEDPQGHNRRTLTGSFANANSTVRQNHFICSKRDNVKTRVRTMMSI